MTMEKVGNALALITMLLLGASTAWLGSAHRDLRLQLAEVRAREGMPQVGQWLPEAEVVSYDGKRRKKLGDPRGPRAQVVYFFLPGCPYCRKSEPFVSQLSASLLEQPGLAEFVPVSVAPDTPDLRADLPGGVLTMTDERMRGVYRANQVPMLLVLSPEGRIEFSHTGVIAKDDIIKLWATLQPGKAGHGSNQPQRTVK